MHLIARDLAKTKRFYTAVVEVLGGRIDGEGDGYFYFDEIFVSDDAMMTTSPSSELHRA